MSPPTGAEMAISALPHVYDVEIVGLVASPAHRYDGRPGPALPQQDGDRRTEVEVRAGHGVVGDRYAGRPAHRDAQVTVLAAEAVDALAAELGAGPLDPLLARRTVVLRGAEVEALRGQEFSLDCGAGEVRLRGGRPANPCAWLDTALAPGAHRGLRGRAGIRCAALRDGVLRLGPAVLRSAVPLDPAAAGRAVRPARPR
ncbi:MULTISPECIES: MOSC domain-containing protein [unclassified Blastococcus]|uniref:MOSC domain-containing protein n=1 Tax=unclassified Blastococcus TaxID=2619396 RepID=UPI002814C6EB|nr:MULTISPECIES: MOSC domain-containing protein [unclassified Blastococcus]